jgi:cytochrome P450
MRPQVERIVDGLLDAIEQAGAPADLMKAFAFPLPIAVVCILLGIDPDRHVQVRDFALIALSTDTDTTGSARAESYEAMVGYVSALISAKRDDRGDDLLSQLIAVSDDDGSRLSEQELLATTLTLLIGGYENTAHQVGKALLTLFAHPEHLTALRDDPSAIGRIVEETLRYTGSLDSGYGSPRYATEDVTVGDTVIPKGATVLVIRASANRDPEQFAEPDRFDPGRVDGQHFSFGVGPHFCLGAPLARLEMETGYVRLVRRFPGLHLTVPVDEVPWAYRLTAAGPAHLPVAW